MANNDVSKSWFITFNNPEEHGYTGTPEQICNRMKDEWVGDSETRSCAFTYCISGTGLHHVHAVLEDAKSMRFSYIKKNYFIGMHIEYTKGTCKQALDYINKRGVFAEKDEEIIYQVHHGEIKGRQGCRRDLEDIYNRLKSGETPADIFADTPKAYIHKDVIKDMFYDIRSENTPIVRPVKVFWHTGKSGSGKSYERVLLSKLYGENEIYYMTAFNSGGFDRYNGQKVLWIEDFRGEFKLQELLRLLDVYKAEVPARFTNVKALWEEVHITSVLTPQQCYPKATESESDRIEQLIRRITNIVYHFKDNSDSYKKIYFTPDTTLNDMLNAVNDNIRFADTFKEVSFGDINDYEDLPAGVGSLWEPAEGSEGNK